MTEQLSAPATGSPPVVPAESVPLTASDRSIRIDRCFDLLADRRRRFCLYHLYRADGPLAIPDLAAVVEASVTPAESDLTEAILEDAVLRLVNAHLPKLRDAGLVAVNDEHVELSSNPPVPIREWLSATVGAELDSTSPRESRRGRLQKNARRPDGFR